MKVTLLQTNPAWADSESNIRQAQQLMDSCPGSDLYVLPEMWSTGFATEPEGIAAAEADNSALEWMTETARSRQCAVSGSLAVRLADDGSYRNRHYFVDGRRGCVSYYDKHHLFTYGHEDRFYTPDNRHTIVSYAGFRILLLTCYDLRFPCWSRYTTQAPYDVILTAACWPSSRQSAWHILTRARAIENQCYLIAVNRTGSDPYTTYSGASCVVDAIGRTLGQCSDGQQTLTVDLELAEQNRRRQKFRVLDDADRFILQE